MAQPPHGNPQATPQPGLAAYRVDPNALPLPPASGRAYGQQPLGSMGAPPGAAPGYSPQNHSPQNAGGFTPPPGGFAPPAPMGAPLAGPYAAPAPPAARGGIVYIIIGLSAVIAVLILVVISALVLR